MVPDLAWVVSSSTLLLRSHKENGEHMVGPAKHGDACCRESPALATISSLSSFLCPTWELIEGLTAPAAGALRGSQRDETIGEGEEGAALCKTVLLHFNLKSPYDSGSQRAVSN
jgi:hypothetical protein